MRPLTFECPRTRREIDAGIETDSRTIAAVTPVKLAVYCPHCDSSHEFPIRRARLSTACISEVLGVPERSNPPAIAADALRTFWTVPCFRWYRS